ncbi:MAG: peptide chain release factor N(5)-glutamine methyltransferase [Gammaproteobacteria bacterium]
MPCINTILQTSQHALKTCSNSPELDGQLLLAHCLHVDRGFLFTWPDKKIADTTYKNYQDLFARRLQGEPIAYLLGHASFWSLDLKVTADTLIPRPETEILVELILARLPENEALKILDLGTGSGAIALALAKERPQWSILATDISTAALKVAEYNRQNLNLSNVSFVESHWLDQVPKQAFDAIVSNPPYIDPEDLCLHQDGLHFEPQMALGSENHGLADLSHIIATASQFLSLGGTLAVEHGYEQQSQVCQLMRQAGFAKVEAHKDLAKNPRVVIAKTHENNP